MSDTRRVGIRELVSAGVINPPLRLFRTYRGQQLEARVTQEGAVQFRGQSFPSLSAAAVAAIKSTRPGREGSAINGWQFWRYTDDEGNSSKIDGLRKKMANSAEEAEK